MPTELEELVGFIASPNPQIRAVALENLVPYSASAAQPIIFKAHQLTPIKNLKILIQDHPKVAEHALTILINMTGDRQVLETVVTDDKFLDTVFAKIVDAEEPNANLIAMLLANLAKSDGFKSILQRKQPCPDALGSDDGVFNQLLDLFVKGQDNSYNKKADYNYLSYVFADLAKHADVRHFLLTEQPYDKIVPLTKLKVFTEHKSGIRRKGVASTIKNVAFEIPSHKDFLAEDKINILPYVLLPIMGSEEYDEEDMLDMLPDLQLLPPDKKRDEDTTIIQTHVETLMLLTSTREARELMRAVKVYPIVRETHMRVEDENVQEACDRLVQVLMRDEEDAETAAAPRVTEVTEKKGEDEDEDEDEDDQIVEV